MTAATESDNNGMHRQGRQCLQPVNIVWQAPRTGLFLEGEGHLGQWSSPVKLVNPAEEFRKPLVDQWPSISHTETLRLGQYKKEALRKRGRPTVAHEHDPCSPYETYPSIKSADESRVSTSFSPHGNTKNAVPPFADVTVMEGVVTAAGQKSQRPASNDTSAFLNNKQWPRRISGNAGMSKTPPLSSCPAKASIMHKRESRCTDASSSRLDLSARTARRQKERKVREAPLSVMISTDFIVSSPVKDNLLLTIALMQQQPCAVPTEDDVNPTVRMHSARPVIRGKTLMGIFKANSPFTRFTLGHHATRVAMEPNAGGASVVSEALSVEYFVRRFSASNIVSEMEVEYLNPNWKKVDYICDIYGQRLGVSVTRAMSYPDPELFSTERAIALLRKKLHGLTVARSGVSQRHSFVKAILHVWCETVRTAQIVHEEFTGIAREMEVEDDVIMVLTVAEGHHGKPIFYESLCKDPTAKAAAGDGSHQRYPFWWVRVKNVSKKSTKVHAV